MNNYSELLEIVESGSPIPDRYRNCLVELIASKIHPQRRRNDLIRAWAELQPGTPWQKAVRLCGYAKILKQKFKIREINKIPMIIRTADEIKDIPTTPQYICDNIL
jgi:hypothetical protein